MSEKDYRYSHTAQGSGAGTAGVCEEVSPLDLLGLGLGAPDPMTLLNLAGALDNSHYGSLIGASCETPPVVEPEAPRPRPESQVLRRQTPGLAPEVLASSLIDRFKYTGLLALSRAQVSAAADADRAQGLSTEAVAKDDQMRALEDAHDQFTAVDLGNGLRVPTPYVMRPPDGAVRGEEMNGFKWDIWMDRRDSDARKVGAGALGRGETADAWKAVTGAKASAEDDATIMRAVLAGRLWEGLSPDAAHHADQQRHPELSDDDALFRKKRGEFSRDGASQAEQDAASVAAFARVAGFGTDCSGYVQRVLTGAGLLPEGLYGGVMTGVGNLTSNGGGLARPVAGGQKGVGNSPLDGLGQLGVQAGDTVRIGNGTHIGVVMNSAETEDEIVLQVSHSAPINEVYHGSDEVAMQPEGARDDIVVYDKRSGRWRAVDSAFDDADLNAKYKGFYRMDADRIDAQVEKDAAADEEKRSATGKKP